MHPTFPKKFQSNLSTMYPTLQKNCKVICRKAPYTPKKFKVIHLSKRNFQKKIKKIFNFLKKEFSKKKILSNFFFFSIFFLILLQFLGKLFTFHIFLGIPQYPERSTCCKFCNITHGSHSTKNLK